MKPLLGQRIVVLRPSAQAGSLSGRLAELGADVIPLPVIRIAPSPEPERFAATLQSVSDFDWVCLTSVNGVKACAGVVGDDLAAAFRGVRVATVGVSTAAARKEYGRESDLVPRSYSGADLAEALLETGSLSGMIILLARAAQADRDLPDTLSAAGAVIEEIGAYSTEPNTDGCAEGLARLRENGCDYLVFTSASTVRNFVDLCGLELARSLNARWVSIGPKTSAEITAQGFSVHAEANPRTMDGIVESLISDATQT